MPRRALALSIIPIALGCQPSAPEPTDTPTPPTAPVELTKADPDTTPAPGSVSEAPFGGTQWGFVQASSASGRVVVLRRFPGDEAPSFGHHGEPSVWPELVVVDLTTNTERVVDTFVDIDFARRWLMVLDDEQLWLVDGEQGSWEALPEVDMEPDQNRCLLPRQAAFSGQGARVGWVGTDGTLHVRALGSGEQWRVATQGRLWRGWPDDEGRGAVLIEAPAQSSGWPLQNTSCACTWCGRFALSYGTYGWSGPSFEIVAVAADGTRTDGQPPELEYAVHGPTSSGCELKASEQDGESLERGPWRWQCESGDSAPD